MKNYIVYYRTCVQVGIDDYEMKTISLLCNENTTMKDIKDWAFRESDKPENSHWRIPELTIVEPTINQNQ